jgi:hypothetical protein
MQIGKVKICSSINEWKIGKRVGDLFDAIRRHQMVHWLDLQGCMLGNDRVKKGLETLQTVKSLDTVDLQDNEIDRTCLPSIQEFLSASNVKSLYLQGNPLKPRDFDEIEPLVTKLGRECTVYCYKDKDQPTRKLVCSTVKQIGGFDESLSFSSAQLNSTFQKYKDRVAFFESAASEEIAYSHKAKNVAEIREAPPLFAGDEALASTAAQPAHTDSSARWDTAADINADDAAAADVLDDNSPAVQHCDHNALTNTDLLINFNAPLEPCLSSSLSSAAAAPASSHIDKMVAMGFQREAAAVAYTQSGKDVQVCQPRTSTRNAACLTLLLQRAVEILINTAAESSSAPPAVFAQKKGSKSDSDSVVDSTRHRNSDGIPSATFARQRRIQDDDDDDDIPVFRGASTALLPLPQSKSPQVVAPNDDDEIVFLRMTQSTQQTAACSSVSASLASPHVTISNDCSSPRTTMRSNVDGRHGAYEDDDAPLVHRSESNHAIQEASAIDAIPPAAALTAAAAPAPRPKLKGLGSLARRLCPWLKEKFRLLRMRVLCCMHASNLTSLCSEVNAALLQRLRDNDSTLTNLKVASPPTSSASPSIFRPFTPPPIIFCFILGADNQGHLQARSCARFLLRPHRSPALGEARPRLRWSWHGAGDKVLQGSAALPAQAQDP